jgi:hypothetical protein
MGLDMYLNKRTYVKNWSHMDKSELHTVTIKMGGKKRADIKPERVSYIIEEVAYWRKFNALHGWFVTNVADGVDDCKEVYVSHENLMELHETLLKVQEILNAAPTVQREVSNGWQTDGNGGIKETTAMILVYDCEEEINEVLPPTPGFFFGSQEIDGWFKQNVDETVTVIGDILKEIEFGYSSDYYYEASW